ncbi:MAG: amidohydrolase family protein, partial [Pseudomonadales bacterium]|nr:amidohydrolase family protein [Pseudomonadales bacterium]
MHYLIQGATAVFGHAESITDIRIANGTITEVGRGLSLQPGEQLLNAVDCVVYPGFVNTHHHLAQSVLKAVPEGMNQGLADWLMSVPYRFWPHIDPDLMYASALLGFYELLRSGTSTCADHHYLYHQDTPLELEDALWQAARDIGIRFTLCRGGATITGSHKGMQKAKLNPESLEQMLARLERSVSRYHQDNAQAMQRVIVAPTSLIHGAAPDHLTELARFARANKLRLHSHLLEVGFDEQQAQLKYGKSAVAYAESVEWLGPDVYFAHLVQATSD